MDGYRLEDHVKTCVADAVWLVHMLLVGFIATGWATRPPLLYVYLAMYPVVVLQWHVLGYCVLTRWEHLLRATVNVRGQRFIGGMLAKCGLKLSDSALDIVEYAFFTSLWILGWYRLLKLN